MQNLDFYIKKIRLRHIAFILVALTGIAITTFTIIILWRFSCIRVVDGCSTKEDYIGAIGILVGIVAAFIGLLVTIMFGNVWYNNYETKNKLNAIDKQSKRILDLYVVALRAEANIYMGEKNYLRAIERWLGVIFYILKISDNSNDGAIEYISKTLIVCISKLDYIKLKEYYARKVLPELDESAKINWNNVNIKEINSIIKRELNSISNGLERLSALHNSYIISTQLKEISDIFAKKKEEILKVIE